METMGSVVSCLKAWKKTKDETSKGYKLLFSPQLLFETGAVLKVYFLDKSNP